MGDDIKCDFGEQAVQAICEVIKTQYIAHADKLDSLQTQIYIVSGVGGGIALVLIVTLIVLAVQLSRFRQRANKVTNRTRQSSNNAKTLNTSLENQQNGQSVQHQSQSQSQSPPPHSFTQQPKPASASAEDELAQLGFSAYTGHPIDQSRGFSSSPAVNSAGGVRVLPRNPPPGFRQNASYNEGYM